MATRSVRLWRGRRRSLLSRCKKLLERLVADRDRETVKAEAGKTPLYLALPNSGTWDEVSNLSNVIAAALDAKT